jgi:hypothetical protein
MLKEIINRFCIVVWWSAVLAVVISIGSTTYEFISIKNCQSTLNAKYEEMNKSSKYYDELAKKFGGTSEIPPWVEFQNNEIAKCGSFQDTYIFLGIGFLYALFCLTITFILTGNFLRPPSTNKANGSLGN